MDTKEILHGLRTKHGLSQEELAERVFVTRQAISRCRPATSIGYTNCTHPFSKYTALKPAADCIFYRSYYKFPTAACQ